MYYVETLPEIDFNPALATYSSLILEMLDAFLESGNDYESRIWAIWEGEQLKLWGNPHDIIALFGYANPTVSQFKKELNWQSGLYSGLRNVASESIRIKNAQVYIGARFDIEKQRQGNYTAEAKTYLQRNKYTYENLVSRNESQLKIMEGQITEETTRLRQITAIVEQLERRLQTHDEVIEQQGRITIAIARQALAAARLQLAGEQYRVEYLLAEYDKQKTIADIAGEEANAATTHANTQLTEAETLLEEHRKYELMADTEEYRARALEVLVVDAETARIQQQTSEVAITSAKKLTIGTDILNKKTQQQTRLETAYNNLIQAESDYATAQKELNDMQSQLTLGKLQAEINLERSRMETRFKEADEDDERRNASTRMQELHAWESYRREAVQLGGMLSESAAHRAATDITKDPTVTNHIYEVETA